MNCEICGTEFQAKRPKRKYCSKNCNQKAYYRRHPEREKEKARKRWHENKPKRRKELRNSRIKNRYNLPPEAYEEILRRQGGVCAICKKPPTNEALSVDHDHITGRVRGLLHRKCNSGLGLLCDSVEILQNAIDYLLRGL